MERRVFLITTGSSIALSTIPSPTLASNGSSSNEVDFEKLVKGLYSNLSNDPKGLRDDLAELAHTIHEQGDLINSDLIQTAFTSVKTASSLARRTQFIIQILHNNDVGSYLDEAWVATVRNRIGVVTRFLPLVGSFNNLYRSAQSLDQTVQREGNLMLVAEEKFEHFAYAIAAFALEIGLWWVGAPYKMAWRGTRFVSNRTLLRVARHLDNRLIALLMSEIHWKIREKVYDEVSAENLQRFGDEAKYILSEFEELREFAVTESVETSGDSSVSYLRTVDLKMDKSDLLRYDFIETQEDDADSGLLSEIEFDLPEWDFELPELGLDIFSSDNEGGW